MKCENEASWVFHPSDHGNDLRVHMAIAVQIPIPDEERPSTSIRLEYDLFPEGIPWEKADRLRSAVVNGFHVGFGFAELPLPPGGIDIVVRALELEPMLSEEDDRDVESLASALYWAAAGMAASSWNGLHALTSGQLP